MKNRGREDRARGALRKSFMEMFHRAGAAGGDDGNRNGCRDGMGQLEVIALLRAVAIHTGQKDLAGPEVGDLLAPFDYIKFCPGSAAVRIDLGASVFPARID